MNTALLLIGAAAVVLMASRKSKPETSTGDSSQETGEDGDFPIVGRDGGRYRMIRQESKDPSGIINIAIYERQGDSKNEYMLSRGGDFWPMAKGGW